VKSYNQAVMLIALSLSFSTSAFADNIEFFASNNTQEIDLQTAYNRLKGPEQLALQNTIIGIAQKNHLEQGRFEDLLGTYKMSSDQNVTADNSEIFIASSYQKISTDKVFMIAKQLANTLKQDSIAVFISAKQPVIGDTVVKLTSHAYTINQVIKLIQDTLPTQYSQAFSLHLNNSSCSNLDTTTVNEVEWLGSKTKPEDIKKSFPNEEITYQYGKAYLVYKNGQKEQL